MQSEVQLKNKKTKKEFNRLGQDYHDNDILDYDELWSNLSLGRDIFNLDVSESEQNKFMPTVSDIAEIRQEHEQTCLGDDSDELWSTNTHDFVMQDDRNREPEMTKVDTISLDLANLVTYIISKQMGSTVELTASYKSAFLSKKTLDIESVPLDAIEAHNLSLSSESHLEPSGPSSSSFKNNSHDIPISTTLQNKEDVKEAEASKEQQFPPRCHEQLELQMQYRPVDEESAQIKPEQVSANGTAVAAVVLAVPPQSDICRFESTHVMEMKMDTAHTSTESMQTSFKQESRIDVSSSCVERPSGFVSVPPAIHIRLELQDETTLAARSQTVEGAVNVKDEKSITTSKLFHFKPRRF